MKIYKTLNNEIFSYEEDGSQDHLIEDKIAITQEEADAINQEKELARIAALSYAEKRALEYPSFADQFDLLYHGGYDAWKSAIDVVKAKYPKGVA
jgi:hypothetical protein